MKHGFRRPPLSFFTPLIAALALVATAAAPRQAGEEANPAEPFVDVVNVEVVNVDVWVTDKEGRPILDLGRDDFTVLRDGQPTEVTNFYVVQDGRPSREEVERSAAATDEAPPLGHLAPELAPEHRLWLVVYVDNFNLHTLHRKRIFPDLRAFLGSALGPGDRAMLVSYDRSLKVRSPFTEDIRQLFDALDEMEDEVGHAAVRSRERTDTLKRIGDASTDTQALSYARQYAESQMNEVTFTARALQELIGSLAGLPGRKAMVYVTSGVPMVAGEEAFQAVATRFGTGSAYAEIPRHDTTRTFRRVGQRATAERVVFYTIDAGGLRGMMLGTAEYGEFMTPGLRSTLESTIVSNSQSSLRLLAQETGGRAILNRNELLPALEEAGSDFRSFYSLGIASTDVGDGRYHPLRVEVNRKGAKVRHRKGYRSRSRQERMAASVRSALLYQHLENPLDVTALWGRPEREAGGDNYLLPVQLKIPLANVILLPTVEGRYEMRLKLYVGVADEHGDMSEIDSIPLGLRIDERHLEAAQGESFVYTHRLLLDRGQQKVALAVFDDFGNRSSIIARSVTAGG